MTIQAGNHLPIAVRQYISDSILIPGNMRGAVLPPPAANKHLTRVELLSKQEGKFGAFGRRARDLGTAGSMNNTFVPHVLRRTN